GADALGARGEARRFRQNMRNPDAILAWVRTKLQLFGARANDDAIAFEAAGRIRSGDFGAEHPEATRIERRIEREHFRFPGVEVAEQGSDGGGSGAAKKVGR